MFVHHIAYQHQNGDIEEFAGSGLTPAAARQNGVYCALSAVRTGRGERLRTSIAPFARQREDTVACLSGGPALS